MSKKSLPTDSAVLDALFKDSPSAVYIKDTEGRYLRVGEGFSRITSFTNDQAIGANDLDLLGPDVADQYLQNDLAVITTGERLEVEETFADEKLGTRYFHSVKMPVFNEQKQVNAIFGISTEITYLRMVEMTLREIVNQTAKDTGQSFLDALTLQLARALKSDYIMIALFSANKSHAHAVTFLRGEHKMELMEYALKGTPCAQVAAHHTCAYPSNAQALFPTDDDLKTLGVEAYVGVVISDMHDEPIGLINVMYKHEITTSRFITEILQIFAGRISAEIAREKKEKEHEKLTEQLEEKVTQRTYDLQNSIAELEAFSYTISHDLRAPLRSINGMAELLKDHLGEKLDDTATSYLTRLQASTQKMARQIDSVLLLTRLGHQAIRWQLLDISKICHEVNQEMENNYQHIKASVNIQSAMQAHGDRVLIELALTNLFNNAYKYREPSRELKLVVSANIKEDHMSFSIADNGTGFDPVYADKLFRPFSRLHSDTALEGEGIGLASVAKIIQRHGGQISASAQLGAGAEFSFTLPRHKPDETLE